MLFVRLAGRGSSLALGGLCMIAPALPLSLGTVAWTAFAERYVYLAIPFWLLAASIAWSRISTVRLRFHMVGPVFVVLLLIVWGRWTFERNVTWQTNLAIFDDTVRKSPNFKVARGLYMLALYENGRYDEALEQYRIAGTLQSLKYDEKFDMLYALIQMRKGRTEEARQTFEKVLHKKETASVLENLIKLLNAIRSPLPTNDPTRQETDALVIQYYEKLYSKTGDALYLYHLGQDYLNNGKRAEAKITFSRAAERLPESSEFKKYARNLAMKL
jgi:tetratricopeptide (TPR) repeat protein